MRKLSLFIVGTVLLLNLSTANAISNFDRWYQIEVIVFSHITPNGIQSENWPWTPTQYIPTLQTINLTQGDNVAYSALPRQYFKMNAEQTRLEKNSKYRVLLHLAWRQKITKPKHAQPIHVYGGAIYDNAGKMIGTAEYGQQEYNSNAIWQVNGTITPSLIRFIDLDFNLLFSQPVSTLPKLSHDSNVQGRFAYFRLKQSRRMRSKELNYIGHPLYGILVKIVPVI